MNNERDRKLLIGTRKNADMSLYSPVPTSPQPGPQPGPQATHPAHYGQPGYPQPNYPQPGYPQPNYSQPGYAQPSYTQPGYGAARYEQSPHYARQDQRYPPQANAAATDVEPEEAFVYQNDRSIQSGCRDWFCTIIFLGQFIFANVLAWGTIVSLSIDFHIGDMIIKADARLLGAFMAFFLPGLVFGFLWLCCGRLLSGRFINISLALLLVMLLVPAFMCIADGQSEYGYTVGCIGIFAIIYYLVVRSRIPFTEALIQSSFQAMLDTKGVFGYHMICFFLGFFYIVVYITAYVVASIEILRLPNDEGYYRTDLVVYFGFLTYFLTFWTIKTIEGISFVTTAGAVGSWWYTSESGTSSLSESIEDRRAPATRSFIRATTTSLGSIAFGAMIVTIVEFLYRRARALRRHALNPCLCICALLCLSCAGFLKRLVQIFNRFAFCQVALYGKDYISASQATLSLLQAKGYVAIMDQSLIGFATLLASMIGGGVTAVCAQFTLFLIFSGEEDYVITDLAYSLARICGFCVGTVLTRNVVSIIDAASTASFVVLAEDPAACEANHPKFFAEMEKNIHDLSN